MNSRKQKELRNKSRQRVFLNFQWSWVKSRNFHGFLINKYFKSVKSDKQRWWYLEINAHHFRASLWLWWQGRKLACSKTMLCHVYQTIFNKYGPCCAHCELCYVIKLNTKHETQYFTLKVLISAKNYSLFMNDIFFYPFPSKRWNLATPIQVM